MKTEKLDDLLAFISDEIEPAISELKNIGDDSRKHLQKLVYTNLVDRFDYTVDMLLLENCREDFLVNIAIKTFDSTVTEADLIKLLLNSRTIQKALNKKLRAGLRNSALRERHSKKLRTLFGLMRPDLEEADYWNKPRVNISTGKIAKKMKPTNTQIPYSICGYVDWLYCRRNTVVHGGASGRFLDNDKAQLKSLFKCIPADSVIIKLSTVELTGTFYKAIAQELKGG